MIRMLTDDDMGVARIPECVIVEWAEEGKRVVFSYAQQGKAISVHFATDRAGLRHLRAAIGDFCKWLFWAYSWCRMIFAVIGRRSVLKIAEDCEFKYLTNKNDYQIYMRVRE
tara:strand:- start:180 stop:515 length:336 start_codon:yes stop_codon:yes gene_type:complete